MTRAYRLALIAAAFIALFALYEAVTSFVAYTDDAYVRSDLVAVAPQVTGRIIAVHVADNQWIKAGDPLIEIDPVPFQLAVNQFAAEIDEAKAQVQVDQDSIAAANDAVKAAVSALALARITQQRAARLSAVDDVSQATIDRADDALNRAQAALSSAQSAVAATRATAVMHQASLRKAEAEMATAEWRLARTKAPAPIDGAINNLTVRVGDTGTANEPLIGIVAATGWRIIANYKQDYIRHFKIGAIAWVWLDSEPWRLHRARIAGVARGISREEGADKLLPYVAPTTDWIRLQRRFPVTLTLIDPPANLYMGADARVAIFP
ncbi:Secretion protein HlyD family protein [Methylocella tundrae]|uniref:Secretion protein HlyD family protein n=1 Tax=Methylocella tundrae TaxID=227605 RepID=A0A8B6M2D7_METTU|nr:HlyD family secretion protein [Methylocella tundrae]VTZ27841.1 Secretion protein HlyD family protein [Methylocella tundrae]VTZ48915.1 Secretion protein HlyD family protein [Methylocella tundrae]